MQNGYFNMNRQPRYEPVPQRDDPIILSPISNNPSYNYNTALPTSVASSSHGGATPSVISIPNSPPPSFHTHSSPGTPRPSHAQMQQRGGGSYAELWGVAASTVGGETIDTSNDALATIKGLKQRVEWLEESIGRLILEREAEKRNPSTNGEQEERNNCCVSFTDASPDMEAALINRGHNCCVTYSGTKSDAKRKEQRVVLAAVLFVFMIVCITIGVIMTAKSGRVNRAVNEAVDKAVKLME